MNALVQPRHVVRTPRWLAQLYMYRYFVPAVRVTLPCSAQGLLEAIRREASGDAQGSLQCPVGQGEPARALRPSPFAGLERDWTKL